MTRPYAPRDQALFDKGLAVRREVLGADYVDRSLKNATDFDIELQELSTQYCWGDVWSRPGLDRRSRSLICLALTTALNRPQELKNHLIGALNNGVTRDEIKEVFLHCAVYCGLPAASSSFRTAGEFFADMK